MQLFKHTLKHVFLLLAFAAIISSCGNKKNELQEPGISKKLAALRKKSISDLSYDLKFDIPKDKESPIQGVVKIAFSYKKTGDNLYLDFNSNPNYIRKVVVNDQLVTPRIEDEHIIIDEAYLVEKNSIEIEFRAGEQSLNRNPEYLYTLFVPERASTCFPLFDQPDLKATFALDLSIPNDWEAVANGRVGEMSQTDHGQKQYSFEPTKPISSYLFAFAVGKFKKITKTIKGRELTLFHRETDSLKVANNVDIAFDWHMKALDWLENYAGIKYPFDKMAFVLIPSFQYGGMEHPGAIFYKASSIFLDESSTLNQQLGRARLIAHEVSHMWFGNLVTMQWFDDVWLKEVFANFMAAKIVEPEFSEINHDLKFLMSHYPGAYAVDRTQGTHAIAQHLDNLKNAGTLYGAIIYQKAPIVMRMLESHVGEASFQEGMREYLNTYAYANATWENLLDILKKHTNYNINTWNTRWVESAGMPTIYVNLNLKHGKIKHLNVFDRMRGQKKALTWPQDLEILIDLPDSSFRIGTAVGKNVDEVKGLEAPTHIFINAGGMGYGHFTMGPNSSVYFLDSIGTFDEITRASLWINYNEIMLREGLNPSRMMDALMANLHQEQNNLIAEYLLERIKFVFWNLLTTAQRQQVAPKLEGLLLNMTIGTSDNQIKVSYFNTLRDIVTTSSGVDLLTKVWKMETDFEGLNLSENDYTQLAAALAIRSDNPQVIINAQLERINNPDRKRRFKFIVPALSASADERDLFFNTLKDPVNRENEEWVLEALSYLHHPLRAASSLKYIRPGLEMLEEIQKTGDIFFPYRWLDATLSGHSSKEADNEVRQFLYEHNDYPKSLKNKILQTADPLFRATQIKEKYTEDEDVIN